MNLKEKIESLPSRLENSPITTRAILLEVKVNARQLGDAAEKGF